MKKYLIFTFILLISCGPSESEIQSQIDEAVNQALETSTSTTSSTTSTMVEEEYEVDPPKVLITNCPAEDINVDIYELEWTAEAGSGDIVYIGILVEKDNANFTRVFFTKEDNADLITFPTAYTSNSYSYQIDNTDSNVSASYIIEINIISEQPNGDQISTYDLCFTNYSPPTMTTTTTTTVPDLNYKFMGRKADGLFPDYTISDIDGLRICAVNRTSTTDALLDIVELNNPIIEYVLSNSINDSFQKFLSGECDLMFQEVSVLNELKLQDSRNDWVIFPENENY